MTGTVPTMPSLQELPDRAARGVAAAALSVACVLAGPTPHLVAALERIYAVAVVDAQQQRRRQDDRSSRGLGTRRPRGRSPQPARP